MGNRRLWTKEEEQFIINNYKNMTDKEMAMILGRSKDSVSGKRRLLKIKMPTAISEKDMNNIIARYNDGDYIKDIAKDYNVHETTILDYLKKSNGYVPRNNRWTDVEIDKLTNNYPNEDWHTLMNLLPNRSKNDIVDKASSLGIKRDVYFWTHSEFEKIKQMYLNNKTYEDMEDELKGKYSISSIRSKLYKEGVLKSHHWTDAELDILINNYETNPEYAYKNINRDVAYIRDKAQKIGLQHPSVWATEEDEYIKNNYKTMSDYEIGEYLNRTRRSIKWRRGKLGLESYFYNNFGNNYPAKDGTICLSNGELYIHNYLLTTNLHIQKEKLYKDVIPEDKTARRFDWVVSDGSDNVWYVEYFGMYDLGRKRNSARKRYKKSTRKKIKDLYKAGIIDKCIFIFPYDLENKTLDDIFSKYIELNGNSK